MPVKPIEGVSGAFSLLRGLCGREWEASLRLEKWGWIVLLGDSIIDYKLTLSVV